jgi:hypothetical protein
MDAVVAIVEAQKKHHAFRDHPSDAFGQHFMVSESGFFVQVSRMEVAAIL